MDKNLSIIGTNPNTLQSPEPRPISLEPTSPVLDPQLFTSPNSTPTTHIYDKDTIELLHQLLQAMLHSHASTTTLTDEPTPPSQIPSLSLLDTEGPSCKSPDNDSTGRMDAL